MADSLCGNYNCVAQFASFSYQYHVSTDVYLSLNGTVIPNNGYVDISSIGSVENSALFCNTNRPRPSGSVHSEGDWFGPDGTRVDGSDVPGFVRDRDPYVIRLVRNTDTTPAEGIYHCEILDNTETEQRVYVGLYNSGGGD